MMMYHNIHGLPYGGASITRDIRFFHYHLLLLA